MRDSLDAINGIGHAAVMTDPGFRAALAGHGYTLDPETGEVVELAGYAGAFSARARQIEHNIDRYEADWRAEHPGEEPRPGLRQVWDRRAWADARPDKVVPPSPPPLEQIHAVRDNLDERWRAIPLVLAGSGLRIGELLGLGVYDVDYLRRTIRVERQRLQSG